MSTLQTKVANRIEYIKENREIKGVNAGTLFILPVFLLIAFLMLYPTLNTLWLSLHVRDAGVDVWVGLSNYRSMFTSGWFNQVVINSFIWTTVGVTLQLIVGFGVALLLHTKFPKRGFVRGLYLIPWVTPGVVVALVWSWMYDPTFGVVNHLLLTVGLISEPIGWLSNPDIALFALIIAALWKRFPFVMIMVLAGLQDIDEQLHKAAIIDGAPFHARLRHVTLPQLAPVLKIVVLLSIIWTFNNFVIIYVATGGGPANATTIFPVEVYKLAFQQWQYGMSSALAAVMLAIMGVVIVLYIRMLRKRGVEL